MIQPISFNVIRQALDWHGFPVPALRQLSFYDFFTDFISAEYIATWTMDQVEGVCHGLPSQDGSYYYVQFKNALSECFCEDIAVTELHWDSLFMTMRALFYVRIDRAVLVMAEGLT